ncbi:MAG: acyl-CoA dehydrogenase [Thermodesulfobacteriota bacterium]
MSQFISDKKDIDFVLHEQLKVAELSEYSDFTEFNKKTVNMIVKEASNLALKEVLPVNKIGDEKGCVFDNGNVIIPEEFKKIWELYKEGEWIAMTESPQWGGQGMPKAVAAAATEFLNGASCSMFMYVALTHGAANLIEKFGTDEQKNIYLENMYKGKWSGTMLLTEPEAGSDVGALKTKAVKNPDGTYLITGEKIFISGGEHEMTENIVHPVLARIEGAPEGTKGISLFLVPKYRVNEDGSCGEFNDVICTGIEHKMGIKGNCTCSLSLGSKGNCVGTLLGEENKGMKLMFHMMNEARLYVGLQGVSLAGASYANALAYAKSRIQGPNLSNMLKGDNHSVPIIQHPDIRRQLCFMKSFSEGIRSLVYYVYHLMDLVDTYDSDEEKEKLKGIIELLIPVAKGYVTDKAFEVCSAGIQVYGGYGFIEEYPQAQLLRDTKITQIYEGTNGIQAMDLLGRKLGMKKGKPLIDLIGMIQDTINSAKDSGSLKDSCLVFENALNKYGETAMEIGKTAMSEKIMTAFSFAHLFMEITGDITVAWMLLQRALISQKKIDSESKNKSFYSGQIKSADFFINTILPVTKGKMDSVRKMSDSAVEIEESSF